MPDHPFLPPLPDAWEPTRATLHAYAHGLTAIPRAAAPEHPKWWHASLKVRPSGFVADAVPIPGGGTVEFRMDLARHQAVVATSDGRSSTFDLGSGATGTEFADSILEAAAGYGVGVEVNRDKFENDEARSYDPAHAELFWHAVTNVSTVMERLQRSIAPAGPVQLWPHGFDLAFEWFGTKTETYEHDGEVTEYPSQLNFGFYPGGDAYFYANPWPFDKSLLDEELTADADWHTEGFEGTMLPYATLAGQADAEERLAAYFRRVFELGSPTLLD